MSETHKSKTILGPDCKISGELNLDNDAVIMGSFSGTLRVTGMLELTDSSQVSGTIIVGTLRLAGHAEADVVAEDGVELLPGATLAGQLFTSRLNVVDGATFQGDVCVGPKAMQAASEAFKNVEVTNQNTPHFHHEDSAQQMAVEQSMSIGQVEEEVEEVEQFQAAQPAPAQQQSPAMNAMLQRRRPKVLSPRPMAHSA